jgi:hypothetical protein
MNEQQQQQQQLLPLEQLIQDRQAWEAQAKIVRTRFSVRRDFFFEPVLDPQFVIRAHGVSDERAYINQHASDGIDLLYQPKHGDYDNQLKLFSERLKDPMEDIDISPVDEIGLIDIVSLFLCLCLPNGGPSGSQVLATKLVSRKH